MVDSLTMVNDGSKNLNMLHAGRKWGMIVKFMAKRKQYGPMALILGATPGKVNTEP